MKPQLKKFHDFFMSKSQFEIPIYQRGYSWRLLHWSNLWRDISYMYLDKVTFPDKNHIFKSHFLGTLITQMQMSIGAGDIPVYTVVDGQQRLVTIFTLLAAIRDYEHFLNGKTGNPINNPNSLSHIIDTDDPTNPDPPIRLKIQECDQSVLNSISMGLAFTQRAARYNHELFKAYEFFLYQLWCGYESSENSLIYTEQNNEFLPPNIPKEGYEEETIFDFWIRQGRNCSERRLDLKILRPIILQRLEVLELLIDPQDEDAALIFESVNSKTLVLDQFDHLKNSVFVRLPSRREQVFKGEWTSIISKIEKVKYPGLRSGQGDQFIYDYLIARGESKKGGVNKRRSYTQFMSFVDDRVPGPTTQSNYEENFYKFLKDDFLYAGAHWPVAVGQAKEVHLGSLQIFLIPRESCKIIQSIMDITAGPATPLILHLLEGYTKKKININELNDLLVLIDSFVARNSLSGNSLSPLRALFMQVMAKFSKTYDINVLREEFTEKGWPNDNDLLKGALENNLYDRLQSRQVNAILRGLEEELAGLGCHQMIFGKNKDEYSIEHIFPRSGPNKAWENDFNAWHLKATQIQELEQKKHRLGNLTAVCSQDNRKLSKKPFRQKCELLKGYIAPLCLNKSIIDKNKWTAKEIDTRTKYLVSIATKKWPR